MWCAKEYPGCLQKEQNLIQKVWDGAWNSTFLRTPGNCSGWTHTYHTWNSNATRVHNLTVKMWSLKTWSCQWSLEFWWFRNTNLNLVMQTRQVWESRMLCYITLLLHAVLFEFNYFYFLEKISEGKITLKELNKRKGRQKIIKYI